MEAVESLPSYRTGTSIPSGCDEGQLFFLQASEAGAQYSLYRCVIGGNAWIPLNPRGDGGAALSNPYEQTVRGYRFVGIIFEPAEATGLSYGTLLNIGNYSNGRENVVADRCIFRVPATASAHPGPRSERLPRWRHQLLVRYARRCQHPSL
jgi:hypothetical protein